MRWKIVLIILAWLGWQLAIPIDFVRSDLGRHIKNGELIMQGHGEVLYKNYYSYTNPDFSFINYHWLFGVFCYALWHYFGFNGLCLVYWVLELITFYIFFSCCQRYSSFAVACACGLLSFPFLSYRCEVRPEGISYLLYGMFWWLLDSVQDKRFKQHHVLISFCALQVIWVNTHIFFIMGPLLVAIFWLQARFNREVELAGVFQKVFFFVLGMCLINPFGINIFRALFDTYTKAVSFPIIESLSVFDVLKDKIIPFRNVLIYFLFTVALLGSALFFGVRRDGFKKYVVYVSLGLILSLAALKNNRMIGLYGYFWIPCASYMCSKLIEASGGKFRKIIEILLVAVGILVSVVVHFDWPQKHRIGIVPGANDAAEFFKRENISGAIFNNYGIGGYLIFHLVPRHKLFVDDRGLAAFPEDFIKKTYVQMQWDEHIWRQMDRRYHFNVIFCYPEQSYWGAQFLANRLADHDWALVFLSEGPRIFVRRNAQNAGLIKRYEIHVHNKDAEGHYNHGVTDAQEGKLSLAKFEFNQAIAIEPGYAEAYNDRGFIDGMQGKLPEALADFNKAIGIDPNFVDAYHNRAITYYQLKEYGKSWNDVDKIKELGGSIKPEFIRTLKQALEKVR